MKSIEKYHLKAALRIRSLKYPFQRMRHGYCDRDRAEIDTWFLRTLPELLRKLKAQESFRAENFYAASCFCARHSEDYPDLPHNGVSYTLSAEQQKKVFHDYEKIIDRMIFLFSEADKYSHHCFCCEDALRRRKCLDEAFALFSKYFNDLWW